MQNYKNRKNIFSPHYFLTQSEAYICCKDKKDVQMVQYLKVGILSMDTKDNYLLHRVLSTLVELTSTLMEIHSTLA